MCVCVCVCLCMYVSVYACVYTEVDGVCDISVWMLFAWTPPAQPCQNDRNTCEEAWNVIVHKFTERYGRSWFVIAIAGDHLRCFRLCFFSFNLSFSLGLQSSVRMYVSVVLCVVHEFAERYC